MQKKWKNSNFRAKKKRNNRSVAHNVTHIRRLLYEKNSTLFLLSCKSLAMRKTLFALSNDDCVQVYRFGFVLNAVNFHGGPFHFACMLAHN